MLFEDWCKENKLEINNDKTKLIRLTQDVRLNFVGYKLSKGSKKRHTFVIAPKNQKKIWSETKKRLKWSMYNKNYDYVLVYLRDIFQYYDICTNMTWLISRVYLYLIILAIIKYHWAWEGQMSIQT